MGVAIPAVQFQQWNDLVHFVFYYFYFSQFFFSSWRLHLVKLTKITLKLFLFFRSNDHPWRSKDDSTKKVIFYYAQCSMMEYDLNDFVVIELEMYFFLAVHVLAVCFSFLFVLKIKNALYCNQRLWRPIQSCSTYQPLFWAWLWHTNEIL